MADLMETEGACGEVFNIGSTEEVTILELAERVREACGSDSRDRLRAVRGGLRGGLRGHARRIPDISKIGELIGWRPTRTLDEILET